MAMLALQFGIQPIVTQQFTSKHIIKSTVIFMQEVIKLTIGIVGISLGKTSWSDVTTGELFNILFVSGEMASLNGLPNDQGIPYPFQHKI